MFIENSPPKNLSFYVPKDSIKKQHFQTQNNAYLLQKLKKLNNTTIRKPIRVNFKFKTQHSYSQLSQYNHNSQKSSKKSLEKLLTPTKINEFQYQNLSLPKSTKNINQARKATKPLFKLQYKKIELQQPKEAELNTRNDIDIKINVYNELNMKLAESITPIQLSPEPKIKQQNEWKQTKINTNAFPNLKICESKFGIDSQEQLYFLKTLKIVQSNSFKIQSKVFDQKLNMLFFVKKYKSTCNNLVLNEINTYEKIPENSNILKYYDHYCNQHQIIMIYQYFEHYLADLKMESISLTRLLNYTKMILQAIKFLCQNKIVQQIDLENIVIINDVCKLCNFEFSKINTILDFHDLEKYYYLKLYKILTEIAHIQRVKTQDKWVYLSKRYNGVEAQKICDLVKALRDQLFNYNQLINSSFFL